MLDCKLVRLGAVAALAVAASVGTHSEVFSAEKTVQLAGFGAKSGVVRSFGINTEAVLSGAIEAVNAAGGVKLADGSMAMMELTFYDDRCNAEEGISVLRRIAGSDAVIAIGPTCSNVAEPLFGILQKTAGDEGDSGLQIPVFTDTAIKGGWRKSRNGRSAMFPTRTRCTRRCSNGSARSTRTSRPSMAVSRRISPIPASPGTR